MFLYTDSPDMQDNKENVSITSGSVAIHLCSVYTVRMCDECMSVYWEN